MSENYSNEALQLAEFESTLRLVRLPNLAVEHRLNSSVDKMLYVYSFTSKMDLY